MPHRYKQPLSKLFPFIQLRLGAALREKFADGYSRKDLRADVMSGLVVGLVAIPLSMALGIASGVAPQNGLYTAIIAGSLVALLGGSRFQVTGPTAAFVVILAPIVAKYGLSGLLTAGFMAGVLLVIMGAARLGRFIQFIPHPVTTGFTAGIAVVIATIQIKDFFGLQIPGHPDHYLDRLASFYDARYSASITEFGIGLSTLLLLWAWPKINRKIPAPIVVLSIITLVTFLLQKSLPMLEFATVGSRFNGIPAALPSFSVPFEFNFETIQALFPSAFAIAMLGAIESLLSAVVADGMAQTRHDPDAELVALGIGNLICPFFGGIPATGAIARTATNIRYGARSPISAVIHALFTLLVLLVFAPWVSYLPMAALAALLVLIAYHMSESKHFFHILRVAPRSDATVLVLCFLLTVFFDMVVGVTVGVVLASILFMNRMASITTGQELVGEGHLSTKEKLSSRIFLYEISGPFFFGAAERAISAIRTTTRRIEVVILLMNNVPAMDFTGLVALESVIRDLKKFGTRTILTGLKSQPAELIHRSEMIHNKDITVAKSLEEAIGIAKSALTTPA